MSHYNDDRNGESDSDGGTSSDDGKDLKSALFDHIQSTESAGSFATFGTIQNFVLPGISVEPVGHLRIPLSESDARTLIQFSHQAPFGRDGETVIDTTVRNTWEIAGEKVHFLNKEWQTCLDDVVQTAAAELGIVGGSDEVDAQLYKMLFYEKGAMFKQHQDTEKTPGMIGTLVICLPSQHTGGTVRLRHAEKVKEFVTSEHSEFRATYLSWYTDVMHEIEPVESGFRWVLTYNLLKTCNDPCEIPTIHHLDARTKSLGEVLTKWQSLGNDGYQTLIYPLEHKYTTRGLRLALLKGTDWHRVLHLLQASDDHGEFYILLGKMELYVTDQNCEDQEIDLERKCVLARIVDMDGLDLSMYKALTVSEGALLRQTDDNDRVPDVQRGGQYMGNQYAEIDQIFCDSVMIIVPKRNFMSFLLGTPRSASDLRRLIKRLKTGTSSNDQQLLRQDYLAQTLRAVLSCSSRSAREKDFDLGVVAAHAASSCNADLFDLATAQLKHAFDGDAYFALGESISLADCAVSEDGLAEAFTKCQRLHEIYASLKRFHDGFVKSNPDAGDRYRREFTKRWLDSILMQCFDKLPQAYEADARALVDILFERSEDNFRCFVLYQGIRTFVQRFSSNSDLQMALAVELCVLWGNSKSPQIYFRSLFRRIRSSVVSQFDLGRFADFITRRNKTLPKSERSVKVYYVPDLLMPIGLMLKHNAAQDRRDLLAKIQLQAPHLDQEQLRTFLMPFCEAVASASYSPPCLEGLECVRKLVAIYLARVVGEEPKRPTDWARPDEMSTETYLKCGCVEKMDTFLADPTMEQFVLRCKNIGSLRFNFTHFKYLNERRTTDGGIRMTKTLRRWEEQFAEWKERTAKAVEAVQQFPFGMGREFIEEGSGGSSVLKAAGNPDPVEGLDCEAQTGSVESRKRPRAEAFP